MPKLALLQSSGFTCPERALARQIELIKQATNTGAQIVVTQELCLSEYFCTHQDPALFHLAVAIPGEETQAFAQVAAELDIVLVISLFERRGAGLFHNTAVVFDGKRGMLGSYRKAHIPQDPGFEEKFYFTPGDSGWPVWKTRFGNIGVLICWDQWFPEAARLMALGGADLLVYPTAIGWLAEEKQALGKSQHTAWETVQRGHAVANGCTLAAVNRVGVEGNTEFWGQSFVSNAYGEVVARASVSEEEILSVELDWAAQEEVRRIWPFFRDRRVDAYQGLAKRWLD